MLATMILYGIKNCDTIKKARRWLEENDIAYSFHDFRVDGLEQATIDSWLKTTSWETLVNKRSTTWRQIDDSVKESLDKFTAIELMLTTPTIIKRPVLVDGDNCMVGFKETDYNTYFGK